MALEAFGTAAAATTGQFAAAPKLHAELVIAKDLESAFAKSRTAIAPALEARAGFSGLARENLRIREDLLAAMASYAEGLTAINDPAFRSKLKTSANKLTGTLFASASTIGFPLAVPLVTPVRNIVSSGISYLAAESNHALALRTVRRMDPVVQAACVELKKDLDVLAQDIALSYGDWIDLKAGNLEMLRDVDGRVPYLAFLNARRVSLKFQTAIVILRNGGRLLESMASAHAELARGEHPHLRVEEFLALAQEIVTLVNAMKSTDQAL